MSINLAAHAYGKKMLSAGTRSSSTRWSTTPTSSLADARQEISAILQFIPLTPDGRLDLSQLDAVLTKKTKLLA